MWAVYVVVIGGGWLARRQWQGWIARREQRLLQRSRDVGQIKLPFSDRELLELCRQQLAAISGEHLFRDLEKTVPLLGSGPCDWALGHKAAANRGSYRLMICGVDVVRVLSWGQSGPLRVVVLVRTRFLFQGPTNQEHTADVFWTMAKMAKGWTRTAVESQWEGRRHLNSDPRVGDESDVPFLYQSAVLEQSGSDRAPADLIAQTGDVIGRKRARIAALDLAQVDARFAPDVIETSMLRLLAGWEAATNGQPDALDLLAEHEAAAEVLRPIRGLPRVIREPEIRRLRIVEVDARATPANVTVIATIRAHPDISHLDLCWRLTLSDDQQHPWLLENPMAWRDAYSYTHD